MNSLWIVNKCCGALHEHIYNKKSTGGLWLDVALSEAKQNTDDHIAVVHIEKINKVRIFRDGNITYYTIPGEPNANYNYKSVNTQNHWREIIASEKPENIVLWGTEFPYGLAVMKVVSNIPIYIYIQGILDSIAKYYTAGLTEKELRKSLTFRDIIKGDSIQKVQKDFAKRAKYEAEMICGSKHVIIENQWSFAYLKKICPDVIAHIQYLQVSDIFYQTSWTQQSYISHTVMCPAAYYPIKGLHVLLNAIWIVKQKYPDVKLIIPGLKLNTGASLRERLRRKGYDKLISRQIVRLGLKENIIYTGFLTATEMAEQMSKVQCFIVSSAIENHSSTLKEAMAVGVPSIAAFVGGIPEYAQNGKNVLLYRYEDYEVAAQHIISIFEDIELCKQLSTEAIKTMSSFKKDDSGYIGLRKIIRKRE